MQLRSIRRVNKNIDITSLCYSEHLSITLLSFNGDESIHILQLNKLLKRIKICEIDSESLERWSHHI
ncbi:hypothetical protein BDB01DRAFT_814667 [Pilobolus umbonatus]|nr:hypothetical protein BDB01DRAFT_814667 [Pilobolus umbonatus]